MYTTAIPRKAPNVIGWVNVEEIFIISLFDWSPNCASNNSALFMFANSIIYGLRPWRGIKMNAYTITTIQTNTIVTRLCLPILLSYCDVLNTTIGNIKLNTSNLHLSIANSIGTPSWKGISMRSNP